MIPLGKRRALCEKVTLKSFDLKLVPSLELMRYYFCCRASVTLTDLDRIQPLLEEGIRLNKAALRSSGVALRAGLATIFSVSFFGKKIIDLLGGQITITYP